MEHKKSESTQSRYVSPGTPCIPSICNSNSDSSLYLGGLLLDKQGPAIIWVVHPPAVRVGNRAGEGEGRRHGEVPRHAHVHDSSTAEEWHEGRRTGACSWFAPWKGKTPRRWSLHCFEDKYHFHKKALGHGHELSIDTISRLTIWALWEWIHV